VQFGMVLEVEVELSVWSGIVEESDVEDSVMFGGRGKVGRKFSRGHLRP